MPRVRPSIVVPLVLFGGGGLAVLGVAVFFLANAWFGVPVGAQGPVQPIAFPHTVHAGAPAEDGTGGLGLSCTFCHRNVEQGAAATVPAVEQCMFCHAAVGGTTETAQAEIQKLRDTAKVGEPILWKRVYRLPDHVQFVHDVHVRLLSQQQGVTPSETCSTCHGQVETMIKVTQVRSLKMGDCVDCHRQYTAPTDCAICHY
ncbi:MAG: cytochrome c3 family protein [Chloroflexi bacterium]|nr:cytochrome c3 family protein [Chloroflexota bacterium]